MKVLITSGGGAKGAFSVGALQHIQTVFPSFDFISGTSTGSLIAAMIAANRLDVLVDAYRNTTNDNVLDSQNVISNLRTGRPFLFDTGPLHRQIEAQLDDAVFDTIVQSPATLCLNATCLQTGKVTVFTTRNIIASQRYDVQPLNTREVMIRALLGSSNQAVFLPPVDIVTEVNGVNIERQYVDGGNREVIPTRVVVDNLPDNEDHEIYVLSNNPHELKTEEGKVSDLLKVLIRALVMFLQEGRENDLETLANYKIRSTASIKVFYIHPADELDPEFPTGLRFDPFRMRAWMRQGRQKAMDVLANFPNGNFGLRPF